MQVDSIYIYTVDREREREIHIAIPADNPPNGMVLKTQQFLISNVTTMIDTDKKSVAPAVAPELSSDSSDSVSGVPQLHHKLETLKAKSR